MSMRKICREIARRNGVSVAEVKRDMQSAIAVAYKNPTPAALDIAREGNIPTPEEFITHVAEIVHTAENGRKKQS